MPEDHPYSLAEGMPKSEVCYQHGQARQQTRNNAYQSGPFKRHRIDVPSHTICASKARAGQTHQKML